MLKVLQICPRVPYPPHDGGAIAMYQVAKGLSNLGHRVTVLAINTPKHFQKNDVLDHLPRVKLRRVNVNTNIKLINAGFNLFKKTPYIVERFISESFQQELQQEVLLGGYDAIHFEGTYVAYYVDAVKDIIDRYLKDEKPPKLVLRVHNLEDRIWEKLAHQLSGPKKWYYSYLAKGIKAFERKHFPKFDVLASISELETKLLLEQNYSSNVVTIPAAVELKLNENKKVEIDRNSVFILSALNWKPNVEAVFWFVEKVWPSVIKKNPQLKLHIAGKDTPKEIYNLNSDSIQIHGFVDSAEDFMNSHNLMLVPLLSGGGMRIKIVEGMALGKTIISSSIGAEGINYTDGTDISICNTPQQWVDKITELINNSEKSDAIGENALTLCKQYDLKTVMERLAALYMR